MLFSESLTREWLSGVRSVEVEGKAGPRHMLGGWMMAQLGMQPRQVRMQEARHVRIDLDCRIGDEKASFQIARPGGGRVIEARAVLPSYPCVPHHVHLGEDALAGSLSRALTHLEPDPVWERALSAATHLDG